MRKKFFAIYALAGALVASPVFTSCIDGEESASVTAVRTAKAEQMKAATEIQKAKEAYDAAIRELDLLEKQAQHEANMADYAKKKAEYEATLLAQQLLIKKNADALAAYGIQTLTDLTTNYTKALSDVATTKKNIYNYNKQISDLEAGKTTISNYIASETARLNKLIADDEAALAVLKKAQEEGMDQDAVQAEIDVLFAAQKKAQQALRELQVELGMYDGLSFYTTIDQAKNLATIKAKDYFGTINNTIVKTNTTTNLYYLSEAAVATARENLITGTGDVEGAEKTLAEEVAKLGTEADKKDATYYDATAGANVQTLYAALAEAKEAFEAAEKVYNEKNEAIEKAKKAVADAQTALDTENAKETPDAAKVAELTTALGTAQTALGTAQAALTSAISTAYTTAKSNLSTAEANVLASKDNIVSYEVAVETAKKAVEDFDAAVAAFSGEDYEAYKEAVAALKAADDAYTEAAAKHTALSGLDNSNLTDNLVTLINNKEKSIAENKAALENIKKSLGTYSNVSVETEADIEAVIAYLEEMIAIEEIKLASYEKQAEEAKAALDAYLAEEGEEA